MSTRLADLLAERFSKALSRGRLERGMRKPAWAISRLSIWASLSLCIQAELSVFSRPVSAPKDCFLPAGVLLRVVFVTDGLRDWEALVGLPSCASALMLPLR